MTLQEKQAAMRMRMVATKRTQRTRTRRTRALPQVVQSTESPDPETIALKKERARLRHNRNQRRYLKRKAKAERSARWKAKREAVAVRKAEKALRSEARAARQGEKKKRREQEAALIAQNPTQLRKAKREEQIYATAYAQGFADGQRVAAQDHK